ncbi:MAG: AAA family ATPase [Anaerolineae bacterium]|nr:AAA family ATPase [Anaerolineae bacterium]
MPSSNPIHLIRALLAGESPPGVDPYQLDEPWRTLFLRLSPGASRAEVEALLQQMMAGPRDGDELTARLLKALFGPEEAAASPAPFPSLHDLAPDLRPVEWLWPGWLPRGFLSLLGAAPGTGKSLLALDLARRVIAGLPLPDGAPVGYREGAPGSATVLYVDSESAPQVLALRAAAWGIDTRRLFALLPPGSWGALDLCHRPHQDHLLRVVAGVRPELIVVDSLSSSTGKGENNVGEVRAFLSFLASAAAAHQVALLLIHHLRKRGKSAGEQSRARGGVTAHDLRGSGHITAVPRSILALSTVHTRPEPDPDSPRRLEVIKSNLDACPPPLGVSFQPGPGGVPHILYGPPPVPYRPPTQIDACAQWLVDLLGAAGRPLRPQDVLAAAAGAGFRPWAVYQARKRLEGTVVDTETRFSPHNCWRLAAD